MHSFTAKNDDIDDPREFMILHHGDYSGDAKIFVQEPDGPMEEQVSIPCSVLFQFVGEYIRSQRIHNLEQASTRQLLRGET